MHVKNSMQNCDQHRLLTCAEMGRADLAATGLGVSGLELMENAGRAVADAAMDMVPGSGRIVVLCGPGNNGGDGFVAARYLAERGRAVGVGLFGDRDQLRGDAREMAQRYQGDVCELSPALIMEAELVIDALFGAGLSRGIDDNSDLADLFRAIAKCRTTVLAVDVPSGMSGDLGRAEGCVLAAERTITFFRRKPGHLLMPGRNLCGDVLVADIDMPPGVLQADGVLEGGAQVWANDPQLWRRHMPGLAVDGHKYSRGHTVVASGGIEMSGAARLAARAALRIGSGLVTVAAPNDALMAHAGQLNAILLAHGQDAEELRQLLEDPRKNAVVIGPGLGLGDNPRARVKTVLASPAAVVLDADALTIAAAAREEVFSDIKRMVDRSVVLTPHEGEFARLFQGVAGSKLDRARIAAQRSGGIIVLKGADTVIAAPDGRAVINENAPPWLATAGSGDVLAGIIGGLLAQGMPAFEAASAAVWLHGAAAARFGLGLIAEDIVEVLPTVLQRDLERYAQYGVTHRDTQFAGASLTRVLQSP